MKEFIINDATYCTKKISAMEQFHLARRLSPLVPGCVKVFYGAENAAQEGEKDTIVHGLEAIANIISKMSNEDAEAILNACLEATERKQSNSWAPVCKNGTMMFDLSLPELLQISWHVLEDNLSSFFPELPSQQDIAQAMKEKGLFQ